MNELKTTRTLDVVAAEIRTLTASMLNGIIEIGRRLAEAKTMVPYGQFGNWVKENTGYSSSTANNFMRLFEEYGSAQSSLFGATAESQTIGKLSYTKALALLALPAEDRESFAEEVHAEDISVRELREKIKEAEAERDEAVEQTSAAKRDADEALRRKEQELRESRTEAGLLREKIRELQDRPVEVAVQAADPKEIEAAVGKATAKKDAELRKLEHKLEAEKNRAENLQRDRDRLEAEQKKLAEGAKENRSAAEQEAEELRKQLAMSGKAMTTFRLRFEEWQNAWRTMQMAIAELGTEDRGKMEQAVKAQLRAWAG